jgi:anti-sigma B factor antagonist
MEEFSVSKEFCEGFRILVVRGEVDEATAPELDAVLHQNGNGAGVIVDLSLLTFMSSAGIHVLLRDRRQPRAIICGNGPVARLLSIVEVERRTPVFGTLDEAIQGLS